MIISPPPDVFAGDALGEVVETPPTSTEAGAFPSPSVAPALEASRSKSRSYIGSFAWSIMPFVSSHIFAVPSADAEAHVAITEEELSPPPTLLRDVEEGANDREDTARLWSP